MYNREVSIGLGVRSRKAVGSLIGIGFLLMILAMGFSFYEIVNRIERSSAGTLLEMAALERDAADENLDIQGVALTVGNSLNLTIKNTGNVFSELEWIGVFDLTLNTQDYYRVSESLNPTENQTSIGNVTILMSPLNTYIVQVLTKLGNIYYGEYPEPTGGGTGGGTGTDETQYYFVDLTGDDYAPTGYGSHSLFSAMQAGPDYVNDTLTEEQSNFSGEIGDTVIDLLEFDIGQGSYPDVVPVSGDIYALAYTGPGNDGWLATVEITPDGLITDTVVDSWEFNGNLGRAPDIIHVSGTVYAVAYEGPGSDGFIITVDIATDGTITNAVIDILEYDTTNGDTPSLLHVSGDFYAIAYTGGGTDGWLATVEIATNGVITNTVVDSLEFDATTGIDPNLSHISGDIYAIVYTSSANKGDLITLEIATNGLITATLVDSWQFEPSQCDNPTLFNIAGDIYALVFRGVNNDGDIATVEISTAGVITKSLIDIYQFDLSNGLSPSIVNVQGDYYAIAYVGDGSDGFLVTLEVLSDGTITHLVGDVLEYDTSQGLDPYLFPITTDIHAIAYAGDANDGFITTFTYVGGAFKLDIEVSWTDLPTKTNEYLTIYGGVMGAETLQVDYWDGAAWVNIMSDVSEGWNVFDVSAYLTNPVFTIRFIDSVEGGDVSQDSWEIDAVFLNLFD